MPLNLKPLHALYQLYNLHEGADLPHPLLILAQLSKKRSSSSDTEGELEWVVAVGGKDPNYKPEQKTGRQRRDANADDEWWGARMSAADVEDLVSGVKGSAKTPQQTVDGIKSSVRVSCFSPDLFFPDFLSLCPSFRSGPPAISSSRVMASLRRGGSRSRCACGSSLDYSFIR
jgi:hypothetical protein